MSILNVDTIQPVGTGTTVTINNGDLIVGTGLTIGRSGVVTATSFAGAVTGNVTGNLSGDIVGTRTLGTGVTVTAAGIISCTQYYGSASAMTAIPGGNITGTIPAASLGNVDLSGIKKDIALLSLQNAVDTNRVAYNLSNSFVEQFEDDVGIGASTQVQRETTGEYLATVIETSHSSDSNTDILIKSNTSDGNTTFTDSGPDGHGISSYGSIAHQTEGGSGRGSSAIGFLSNGQYLRTTSKVADLNLCDKSNTWTLEFWLRTSGTPSTGQIINYGQGGSSVVWRCVWNSGNVQLGLRSSSNWSNSSTNQYPIGTTLSEDTWYHLAWSNSGGTLKCFVNGALTATYTGVTHSAATSRYLYVASYFGTTEPTGRDYYMDNIRISDNARYTAAFVPETTVNATGLISSKQNTVTGARTKVSGVLLYKDTEGTAGLGTDLKVSVTCNGGTNWTPLSSGSDYSVGSDFSTGVKTVYLSEKTCTAGTDIRYKVEFANQARGSKVTEVHGMALNY